MARDPRDPGYADFGLFVDGGGARLPVARSYPVTDPATDGNDRRSPRAGPADVAAAIASAAAALPPGARCRPGKGGEDPRHRPAADRAQGIPSPRR